MKRIIVFLAALILIIISLWIIIPSAYVEEEIKKNEIEYPDIQLFNSNYNIGREGINNIKVTATKSERNFTKGISSFDNVSFSQDNLSGNCDTAIANEDNQTVTLKGNVIISKTGDKNPFTINADEILWDNEKQILSADGEVFVTTDNFSINGYGLNANIGQGVFEFGKILMGRLENDK